MSKLIPASLLSTFVNNIYPHGIKSWSKLALNSVGKNTMLTIQESKPSNWPYPIQLVVFCIDLAFLSPVYSPLLHVGITM